MTPIALPLLDPTTLPIDNSSLETFKTCARMWQYAKVQRRKRAGAEASLDFGKAIHAALETRYKQAGAAAPSDAVAAAMHAAIDTAYTGIDTPLEEWKTLARANEIVDLYNAERQAEPFEVLAVEAPFAIPVGEVQGIRVLWTGRIDLLVRWEGMVYVLDHKTMGQWSSGKGAEFENSAQFKGYAWAMQEMHRLHGAPFPERVHGFCLNALVMRKPANSPRATVPRNEFHRTRCFYSQERLEEWRSDMLEWVNTLMTQAARGYLPMNTKHCASFFGRNCPYLDCCTAPVEQRQLVLGSDLYVDDTWNPLERDGEEVVV